MILGLAGRPGGAAAPSDRAQSLDRFWVGIGVAAALTLAGLVAVGIRAVHGLSVTGLTSQTPWGAWIALYIYFVGLSAGAFLLSTLIYVFGMEAFEAVARDAVLVALLCMGVALGLVLIDLGHMERFWVALRYWNPTSVLAWEIHLYVLYVTLLAVELVLAFRPERHRKALRAAGILGIPLAVFGVHGGTGLLFAVLEARPAWNSGLYPVLFVVSALFSGTALVAFLYLLRSKLRGTPAQPSLVAGLSRLILLFLAVEASLEVFEYLVGAYGHEPQEAAVLGLMWVGPRAWTFWGLQVVVGLMLPALLLSLPQTRHREGGVLAAAALVLAGILGMRFNIVVPQMVVPVWEGLPMGWYDPTLVEWLAALGPVGGGILVYGLAHRYLPMEGEAAGEAGPELLPVAAGGQRGAGR